MRVARALPDNNQNRLRERMIAHSVLAWQVTEPPEATHAARLVFRPIDSERVTDIHEVDSNHVHPCEPVVGTTQNDEPAERAPSKPPS